MTVWVLLALSTALLGAAALAIDHALLWTVRAELQVAADAAALAGAAALVGDDLLRGDSATLPTLLQQAATTANAFAGQNPVAGQPFALQANPDNTAGGDLVFGTVQRPRSRDLVLLPSLQSAAGAALAQVNLVQVSAQLTAVRGNAPRLVLAPYVGRASTDVRAEAAATLDRDVIGFRPLFAGQALPLAPLALLADPEAAEPLSWEFQVQAAGAPDKLRFDPVANAFTPGADGLPEFQAVLALDADHAAQANVSVLYLGVTDVAGAAEQLQTGILPAQLEAVGGELVLRPTDNRLPVPGAAPAAAAPEFADLYQNLAQLNQNPRPQLWPLYCGTDATTGQPLLCGFVAARVAAVQPPADGVLTFSLQPTMIATSLAVTDAARRGVGGIAIVNPYICKVRLVE